MNDRKLAIYLHWPFCLSKCPYCDFFSAAEISLEKYRSVEERLLEDLKSLAEIDNSNSKIRISSIFFGGGTPSLMSAKSVENIVDFLCKNYSIEGNAEISLEANPGTFDKQKINEFRSAGINRLSLGVQSFSDTNLKFLGRMYDSQKARQAAVAVAETFENFSIDLMYGYKCQSIASLEEDLRQSICYGYRHISCYQLTFEENTEFYNQLLFGKIKKISETQEVKLYKFVKYFLEMHNIFRYEISNYAKKGYESIHNMSYWQYDDYLGVGPGAHSRITIEGKKYAIFRESNVTAWLTNRKNHIYKKELNDTEILQEMILCGLRMNAGIFIKNLKKNISKEILDKTITSEKLELLLEKKIIAPYSTNLRLTDFGLLKLNSVIEFLLGE